MHRLVNARRCFHSSAISFTRTAVIDNPNPKSEVENHAKRNEAGVQLLSRKLHEQVFKDVSFPAPASSSIHISREHLESHGLDPTQTSVFPNTAFTLPPLQGRTLDEHFHRIGSRAAYPWRGLATKFAASKLPPQPEHWDTSQSGWTKYHYRSDGSSFSEHVPFPAEDEQALVFDVETMPSHHPYAVLACAASADFWYAWISPWLLGESDDPQHLIPLGNGKAIGDGARLVVGHNVSYDRARIREEYNLAPTRTRFLDTMALHVAVSGISSHQRPAWISHRKSKLKEREDRVEAAEVVTGRIREVAVQQERETDVQERERLRRIHRDMEESLPQLEAEEDDVGGEEEAAQKRWEDITSANSLADVSRLHCGIQMDKEIRNDFMTHSPSEILDNLTEYLHYCATDVSVTHAVFSKVLPAFILRCPSPVSFASLLTMGSSFLPVNGTWEVYLQEADKVYKELDGRVKQRLKDLAEEARGMAESGRWKDDVWLSQLDWTPKAAGKSRGVIPSAEEISRSIPQSLDTSKCLPVWYAHLLRDPLSRLVVHRILPLLLKISFDGHPLIWTPSEKWHYLLPSPGPPPSVVVTRLPSAGRSKTDRLLGPTHGFTYLQNDRMLANDMKLALAICEFSVSHSTSRKGGKDVSIATTEILKSRILTLAKQIYERTEQSQLQEDPWLRQLDWTMLDRSSLSVSPQEFKSAVEAAKKPPPVLWPKWYWDQTKPRKDAPPGTLEVTVRNRIAPLLLRLSWLGWPLFHSREHGWTFRVSTNCISNHVDDIKNGGDCNGSNTRSPKFAPRGPALAFHDPADSALQESCLHDGFAFYKLPHKDGDSANVGTPLGKTFIKYAIDGTMKSPGDEAREALEMNAMSSYWISARDRIMKQLVVWQNGGLDLGFPSDDQVQVEGEAKWGMILPQVITMGTVTRRAIERTWLTASNAKANRIGSELKAMVRAPPGYVIVGADVDSEELWISSCMGDSQFGIHGATALGWMTLEGTKAAGTDLHSKTASILGISRDQAKVFNYSRIYGAGMRHAVLLLLQSNPGMVQEEAQKLAENLYASTKGRNTHRVDMFGRRFWFGGTESFVFNKLEEIAMSDCPQTPALRCGITHALSKEHLPAEYGSDYMPSRINWVVQSSGVDYLHLLIVSMEHLIAKYTIDARYLISVHDELRYLVADHDRYRAVLALQIANLWTRSLFALKLGMDDLPRGVAFFSAVDIDKVLRKEVDMPCVTPSQPTPVPPGETLDIDGVLAKTGGGSLMADGRPMEEWNDQEERSEEEIKDYVPPDYLVHRAPSAAFLRAQATTEVGEIKLLAQQVSGQKYEGGIGKRKYHLKKSPRKRSEGKKAGKVQVAPVGDSQEMDWSETVENIMNSGATALPGSSPVQARLRASFKT